LSDFRLVIEELTHSRGINLPDFPSESMQMPWTSDEDHNREWKQETDEWIRTVLDILIPQHAGIAQVRLAMLHPSLPRVQSVITVHCAQGARLPAVRQGLFQGNPNPN